MRRAFPDVWKGSFPKQGERYGQTENLPGYPNMKMDKNALKISPDFTVEDIHKIREANEERRQVMTKEAYQAEVRADALSIQERILKIREKRLSQR